MQVYDSLSTIQHDRLAELVGGKFKLTFIIANRLRDINKGARFLVAPYPNEAPIATICREILEGQVWIEVPDLPSSQLPDNDYDLLALGDDSMSEF